jgi:ATP-dependent DNA helicase RecQ
VSEQQWRAVLRQLIALGHVRAEGDYNTLELTDSAREVLRGEVPVRCGAQPKRREGPHRQVRAHRQDVRARARRRRCRWTTTRCSASNR